MLLLIAVETVSCIFSNSLTARARPSEEAKRLAKARVAIMT